VRRRRHNVATAIALAIVLAMALGFGIQQAVNASLTYLGVPRQGPSQQQNPQLLHELARKITVMLRLLDATPAAERPVLIAAAQRPSYRIRLVDTPIQGSVSPNNPDADLLRRRIEARLITPHPLIVADWYGSADQKVGARSGRFQDGVTVEAALSDGHWVAFERKLKPQPTQQNDILASNLTGASLAAWLLLCAIVAVLLALLVARKIVKPLSELSAAMEQLGGSAEAPPTRPWGPSEVDALMQTFNRMQERLRRFNDDRTRMFASMSHDLRSPLTRLRLRVEMLEGLPEQQKMLAELDTTNDMIESILTFARDETQHEPRSLVDLSALVEGVCQDASDSGEPVTFDGPRGVTISCRPIALRRAISNLVDNAVKYGKIALVTLSPGPDHVAITIDDEGPGIPWNEREKVFEPFYRADSARNPNTGGVGLGLCVTRSIVWEHGGDIGLANRKGGGLSVRLKLPIATEPIGRQEAGRRKRTLEYDRRVTTHSHAPSSSFGMA
jgi:signal transduction histidine kinase